MDRRTFLTGAAAIGIGAPAFRSALAQSFPSNVIRIVVPSSTSTPPDILARIIASALSDSEGWKVVVENKPGALTTIGAIVGLLVGGGLTFLIRSTTPINAAAPPQAIAAALIGSALAGIIFGLLPAARAARLDPVEALRYE